MLAEVGLADLLDISLAECALVEVGLVMLKTVVVQCQAAEQFDALLSIVEVECAVEAVVTEAQSVVVVGIKAAAKSLSATFHSLDPHHGIDLGIILSSRSVDHFHLLDFLTRKTLELADIIDLPSIDIIYRRALSNHLNTAISTHEPGHTCKSIGCRAGVSERSAHQSGHEHVTIHLCLLHSGHHLHIVESLSHLGHALCCVFYYFQLAILCRCCCSTRKHHHSKNQLFHFSRCYLLLLICFL